MMDDKDKCRNVKNKMLFSLITRRNITKKHDEILSFDYPLSLSLYIYIYI